MARPMNKSEYVTTEQNTDYAHQAYTILKFGFTVAPIVAGLDKFFNLLVDWTQYLTPLVPRWTGIDPAAFMMVVGIIEIIAGIVVAVNLRSVHGSSPLGSVASLSICCWCQDTTMSRCAI